MNRRFSLGVGIGLMAGIGLPIILASAVIAQSTESPIDENKLNMIRTRCSSSQFALQQIQKRDAVSRINRGRAYDQMLRQVSAFNSRFAYNKINAPDLIQFATELQNSVDSFRAAYDHYDTDISDALKVDCKSKPAEYYNLILKARTDRLSVGAKVQATADLMSQYRATIVKYKDAL